MILWCLTALDRFGLLGFRAGTPDIVEQDSILSLLTLRQDLKAEFVVPSSHRSPKPERVRALRRFATLLQFWSVFADSIERCRLEKGLSDSAGNASLASRPPGIDRPIAKKDPKWLAPPAVFYRQPLLGRRCNWLDWAAIFTMVRCQFSQVVFRRRTSYHPLIDGVPGQIREQVILWRILICVRPLAPDKPVAPFGRD